MCIMARISFEKVEKFPSPFGVRVLKYDSSASDAPSLLLFPSPFGVRVLKSGSDSPLQESRLKVSVPFRGSCSEMRPQHGGTSMG